jgi:Ca2+-binding RTX toxin-like protein
LVIVRSFASIRNVPCPSPSLAGEDGSDTLIGGAGADALHGGGGVDAASYAGSSAGVAVNLLTGVTSGGDAAGDTFTSIEDLIGSAHADTISANAEKNRLNGGLGNDTLAGDDGSDTLIGGAGADCP